MTISVSIFYMYQPENPKLYEKKRSIMAKNRLKYIFLSNYLMGEISGHNYRMIGKTWVSMGLDTPPWLRNWLMIHYTGQMAPDLPEYVFHE